LLKQARKAVAESIATPIDATRPFMLVGDAHFGLTPELGCRTESARSDAKSGAGLDGA
jgi:hypothetical protein